MIGKNRLNLYKQQSDRSVHSLATDYENVLDSKQFLVVRPLHARTEAKSTQMGMTRGVDKYSKYDDNYDDDNDDDNDNDPSNCSSNNNVFSVELW